MICGCFQPLALRKELISINKRGHPIYMNGLVIKYLINDSNEAINKMAFIVRKKIGNSVMRNLIKRRIRGVISKIYWQREQKINIIIIAKTELISYPFNKLEDEINHAFCKIFEQIDVKIN